MAAISQTLPAATLATRGPSTSTTIFGRMVRAYRAWRDYQDTVRQLGQLTPRQLADIGVDGDVEAFARGLVEKSNR